MKRKILKTGAITLALSMFCSIGAFANQVRSVKYEDAPFSSLYVDGHGVSHYIIGTASCDATVEWIEGYYGWINSANFPEPYATIEGNIVNFKPKGPFTMTGSTAYYEYYINNENHIARPTVGCDEYGDTSFYVKCW